MTTSFWVETQLPAMNLFSLKYLLPKNSHTKYFDDKGIEPLLFSHKKAWNGFKFIHVKQREVP